MRLLTNDEMLAVSGGDINGQDDPTSLNGNPSQRGGRSRGNRGSTNGSGTNRHTQLSQACPGGWEREGPKWKVGTLGAEYEGEKVKCDTGNKSDDNGDESGNDDD